ncbi:unnamed protein product [Gongylonema pulchrum]|uniref:C2H2-type domain-containing protein n=1 Tax=Gongylonema pulchrum TaxID=637853 RepID=A0A3P7M842_9BILA|nr:unnamed protein product [Gongylonema pulchrum]
MQDQPLDLSVPKNTTIPPEKQQYNVGNAGQFQGGAKTSPSFDEKPSISNASMNASIFPKSANAGIQCPECGKQLGNTRSLLNHRLRFHNVESPYVCNVCSRKCVSNSDLIAHMRVHTGERPFKCNLCSKGFSQTGSCQRHMRTHTDEKPRTCEFCNKNFSNFGNLEKHKKIHKRPAAM